jgi:hypothetical protein
MDNQSSPAQLLFPTVPSSYCPEGNWSDIFNSFIQLYLNNGTINVPGLGLVTPQEIQTINQNIQNLQNSINALTIQSQTGSVNISTSNSAQTFTITFPTAMPNANYQLNVYFAATNGTGTSPCSWGIIQGTNTTTGFRVWIFSNNSDISSFIWTVTNITTTS